MNTANTAKHNKALMGALPLLAQALGRKFGVKVVLGGNQPCTDGKTITLPRLPVDDEDTAALVSGYLDHECGHVRATDFEDFRKAKTPFEHSTLNVIEDVRIEGLMGKLYPGCRTNLAVLVKKLVRLGDFQPVADGDPASIVSGHLLYSLRTRVLGQTGLDKLAQDAADKLDATYPGLRAELDRATAAVETADSTSECLAITKKVVAAVKKYIKEPPKPPEPPKESPESPSSPSQGQEEVPQSGGGAQSGDKPQDGPSSRGQDQPAQDAQDGQGSGGGQGQDKNQQQPAGSDSGGWNKDQAKTLEKVLAAEASDLAQGLGEILKDKLDQKSEEARKSTPGGLLGAIGPSEQPDLYNLDGAKVRAQTNALRVRLASLLAATVHCRRLPSSRGRQLDSKKIVRLRAGIDQKVFRGRDVKKGINTAVHLLVDRSGSMERGKIGIANDCMLAVKLALDAQRGVNLGISTFPSDEAGCGYSPVLRHGEKTRSTRLGAYASGGTPLGEALWGVAVQMLPLKEERKIIIVLTDGHPQNDDQVHRSIRSLKKAGFETVGIGIQCDAVSKFFENHLVVQNVSDLPNALFKQLEKLLT
jgi:uncharacterized protein YegL